MTTFTRIVAILLVLCGLVAVGFVGVGYIPIYKYGNLGSTIYDFRVAVNGVVGMFGRLDGLASVIFDDAELSRAPKTLYIFSYKLAQNPSSEERAYIVLWGWKDGTLNDFGSPNYSFNIYAYKDFDNNENDANSLEKAILKGYTYLWGGTKYQFVNAKNAHVTDSLISNTEISVMNTTTISNRYLFEVTESGLFDVATFLDLGLTLTNAND